MKFKFALATLLQVNKRKEDTAKAEFGKAEAAVAKANRELRQLHADIDNSRQTISNIEKKGGVISHEIKLHADLILSIKKKIELKKQEIMELEFVLEDKREIMVLASQEAKKVEKLRDKSFENYKLKRKKRDLKRIDDIMVMRFNGDKVYE